MALTPLVRRVRAVWGQDAEAFNPDHFSPEAEQARPANAYLPFGNGQRACIGRQFAMQEATLVLGMILQRFRLIDHARYQLKIKETLTIKPDGLHLKVRRRMDRDRTIVAPAAVASRAPADQSTPGHRRERPTHHTPLLVLYRADLGAAAGLARQSAD